MINLTLLSFKDCPNAEKARKLLRNSGVAFQDVMQDDLPANHPYRGYTSPSILKEGKVIYGIISNELGCSIWNDQELYKILKVN